MYKLTLVNNEYSVICTIKTRKYSKNAFIVDTGACNTCCYAPYLDPSLSEHTLRYYDYIDLIGIAQDRSVKYYRYPVKSISFAGLNLGPRDIWVTFDPDATDCLLGMDILSDCNFIKCASDRAMYFFA